MSFSSSDSSTGREHGLHLVDHLQRKPFLIGLLLRPFVEGLFAPTPPNALPETSSGTPLMPGLVRSGCPPKFSCSATSTSRFAGRSVELPGAPSTDGSSCTTFLSAATSVNHFSARSASARVGYSWRYGLSISLKSGVMSGFRWSAGGKDSIYRRPHCGMVQASPFHAQIVTSSQKGRGRGSRQSSWLPSGARSTAMSLNWPQTPDAKTSGLIRAAHASFTHSAIAS